MLEELMSEWKFDWKYWKDLLQTNGKWSERKIRNEMHDLAFVMENVGKVYMALTGEKLSKPMYYAETIITAHEDACMEAVNQYRDMLLDDCKDMTKEEIIEYVKNNA
jgi:hypothetical protein